MEVAIGSGAALRQLHNVHEARRLQEAQHERSSDHLLQPHRGVAGCLGGDSGRFRVLVVAGGHFAEACATCAQALRRLLHTHTNHAAEGEGLFAPERRRERRAEKLVRQRRAQSRKWQAHDFAQHHGGAAWRVKLVVKLIQLQAPHPAVRVTRHGRESCFGGLHALDGALAGSGIQHVAQRCAAGHNTEQDDYHLQRQ